MEEVIRKLVVLVLVMLAGIIQRPRQQLCLRHRSWRALHRTPSCRAR